MPSAPTIPEGTKVVDASGKFLIPGLWDMHVHLTRESSLALNLANGVTGLRVMWGNPAAFGPVVPHATWKREIEDGKRVGPRLVVASNIIDGPKPIWPGSRGTKDPDDARKAVHEAKAAGADFVKVYSLLPPESFRAIAEETKAQGLPFAGHVPLLVSAAEASDLGMKSIEHLTGLRTAASPKAAEALAAYKTAVDEAKGDLNAARPKLEGIEARIEASESDEADAAFFARLKANGTWQCPTLSVLRALGMLDDPKFTDDPRLKYVDPFTRTFWNPKLDFRFRSMRPEDFAANRRRFDKAVALVGRLYRVGVPILAGTDEANPYIFPGFSLHDELGLLAKAGLPPLAALQAATIGPARYLGREAVLGSVEPGKEADLVLLDADPLADIAHTKSIRAVISRGRFLDRPALDAMLKAGEHPVPKKPTEASKPST